MDTGQLTRALKTAAEGLGFPLTGACPAVPPPGLNELTAWLKAGYAGTMTYMADRAEAYCHPSHVLDGARSILMLAMPYRSKEPKNVGEGQGKVSRYAWGAADYHDVIHSRLCQLAGQLRDMAPGATARGVVDTAPLLERQFAQLAGLGWLGKNTLLLNQHRGSWFFLAALLTDVELSYDTPHGTDHCGTCTACLDACPTNAFPQPYVLDATRCISYLTIELRDEIPQELRKGVGDWLFGCDRCQEVCPWNRRTPVSEEESFQPIGTMNPVELIELFRLSDEQFRERYRRTPLWRSKRKGLLRNAAIVLGNQLRRGESANPAGEIPSEDNSDSGESTGRVDLVGRVDLIREVLQHGLTHEEQLVREACAWALSSA